MHINNVNIMHNTNRKYVKYLNVNGDLNVNKTSSDMILYDEFTSNLDI